MNPLLVGAAGIAFLSAMDAVIKHQSVAHAVPLVLCLNYWARLPFAAVHWRLRGARPVTRDMWRYHAVRAVTVTVAATFFFIGVARLPLAEAVTLSFVAPLIIPFVAWALLGQRPRRSSLVAAAVGFAGVLVAVVGADGDAVAAPGRTWGIVATLGGASAFALSLVLLSGRAAADGPARVNLLGSLLPAGFLTPVALIGGGGLAPSEWPWSLIGGAFGAVGMALYATAYARAQAQQLAPLEYSALLWAAILGFAFFGEIPHPSLAAGAALIVAAGFLAARDEKAARTAAAAPPLGD